jgi:protein involved in temperature-dependent protein secretion
MTIDEAMEKQRIAISNMRYLLKRQKKRIGDLENEIGVSKGYFARYQDDSERRIPLLTMLMAADYLNIPLQDLFSADIVKTHELADLRMQIAKLKRKQEELLGV